MTVHDLRCILAGGIHKEMLLIVLVVRAVDVTVTQRQLQVRRDLTAPLTGLAILLGCLHCLVDCQQGLLVLLRDQAGNGILSLAAVDALCFKNVCKRDTARNHDLSCTGNLVSHNKNPPSICFCVLLLPSVEDSKFIFRSLQIDCLSGVRIRDKGQLTGRLDHKLSQNLLELFLPHELFKGCQGD